MVTLHSVSKISYKSHVRTLLKVHFVSIKLFKLRRYLTQSLLNIQDKKLRSFEVKPSIYTIYMHLTYYHVVQ